MGRRPDRSVGALACCKIAAVVLFVVCTSLLLLMVATTSGVGVSSGPNAAARAGARTTTTSPAWYPGAGQSAEDAYRSSKRRIPKGPDPIHNRRAGKTTIAPRRRD